jgi:hypothetical protein
MPGSDMPGTSRTDLEIAALRELISRAGTRVARDAGGLDELLGRLSDFTWADEEHRVVYECVRSARGHHKLRLREEMAAEATRMGHPDVDWSVYFLPSQLLSEAGLLKLIRRLKNNP